MTDYTEHDARTARELRNVLIEAYGFQTASDEQLLEIAAYANRIQDGVAEILSSLIPPCPMGGPEGGEPR